MTDEPTLTAADYLVLDRILCNEADMAYRRRARALLDYLEVVDGDRVLDCGCGMGFYLATLAQLRRVRLVGVDRDPRRLGQASRRTPAGLVRTDAQRLPFADGVFDKVLMSEVLEHLPSATAGLREAFRVLRPAGVLAISVPHAAYPFWWDPINRTWAALGGEPIRQGPLVGIWTNHERLYEPHVLAQQVTAAGFRIEVLEEATHFAVPFSHFLLYGVGKPLLERGYLPPNISARVDRLAGDQPAKSRLSALQVGISLFEQVDKLNDSASVTRKHTFVNVLLKARKP